MSVIYWLIGYGCEYRRTERYPFRRTYFALPYLAMCAALAVGELAGFASAPASSFWPLALFVLVIVALTGYGAEMPYWHYAGVFLLGFTLALFSESCRSRVFDACEYSSGPFSADFEVRGRISFTDDFVTFSSESDGVAVRVVVRKDVISGDSGPGGGVPRIGEVWRCTGWLERMARSERARRTLWVSGRGSRAERIAEAPRSTLPALLQRLRRRLSANIGYGLSHDPMSADLDRAMILGERTALSRETRMMFADAGTIHVFAISGLHVGVFTQLVVYTLMMLVLFPWRWMALPLVPVLGCYVMMIDLPPSAVRAAVMQIVYRSAPLFFRRSDSLVAWSVTFMVFHLLDPTMLFNVGSLLSFSVMLGILLFMRWAEAFDSAWVTGAGVSVAAWVVGVGITARVFERLTLGGLAANVIVLPLADVSVTLGVLGAAAGMFCERLASHFNNAAALTIKAMSGVSWIVSRIPYGNIEVRPWSNWVCAAWYAVVLMSMWLVRSVWLRRRQRI